MDGREFVLLISESARVMIVSLRVEEYHYQVTIVISDTEESVRHGSDRGYLTVQLHGDQSISAATRLTSESIRLEPGKAYSYVLSSHWLGRIQMITVEWHYASSVFNPFTWRIMSVPAIHINRIIVHNFETNNRFSTFLVPSSVSCQ